MYNLKYSQLFLFDIMYIPTLFIILRNKIMYKS